jgi:hypothetical protein
MTPNPAEEVYPENATQKEKKKEVKKEVTSLSNPKKNLKCRLKFPKFIGMNDSGSTSKNQKRSHEIIMINHPKKRNKKAKGELNLLFHRDYLTIYMESPPSSTPAPGS